MKNALKYCVLVLSVLALYSCGGNGNSGEGSGIAKDVSVEEFSKMLAEKGSTNAQLIDVRTPEEYEAGHVGGAPLMNFYDDNFAAQLKTLDKNKPVLVYCKSGGRSGKAMDLMNEMGFTEVYNLDGGYNAWVDAGKPTSASKPKFQ